MNNGHDPRNNNPFETDSKPDTRSEADANKALKDSIINTFFDDLNEICSGFDRTPWSK